MWKNENRPISITMHKSQAKWIKWIKDLNIKPATINLIKEKVGSILERIGTGNHFLNITPGAHTERNNKCDLLKLRRFYKARDTNNKAKWQPTEWEKIFTNPTSDRGLISKIYKELKKLDIKIKKIIQ